MKLDEDAGLPLVFREMQRMHRERLTITGRITCLTYGDGGTAGCGG